MRRVILLGSIVIAGLTLGTLTAIGVGRVTGPGDVARFTLVGWAYLAAGITITARRRDTRIGWLLLAFSFSWWPFPWMVLTLRLPGALRYVVLYSGPLHNAIFVWLVFAFPTGRITSRRDRIVLASVSAFILFAGAVGVRTELRDQWAIFDHWLRVNAWIAAGLALAVLAAVTLRWQQANRPTRRLLTPMWIAAAVVLISFVATGADALRALTPRESAALGAAVDWGQGVVPIAYLVGLLRLRSLGGGLAQLVLELHDQPPIGRLRDALSRTLEDPSLELGLWLPDAEAFVTPDGRPFTMPRVGSDRSTTVLERNGERLAVLVYDASLSQAPSVIESISAATALALENERLQAAVKSQLESVRASRQRIIEAIDAERRRIERNIHDGAQQRLMALSLALRRAENHLDGDKAIVGAILADAGQELNRAVSELRDLARGIHPSILTDEGIGPAIDALVDRCAVPISVHVGCTTRLPESVEATGYYLVAEALTNATRYADASLITVCVDLRNDELVIDVADNGTGGADPSRGTGLRGLADRVAAIGGTLEVDSPVGRGTRLRGRLPCG